MTQNNCNVYIDQYSDPSTNPESKIFFAVTYSILFLLGILGNAAVLLVTVREKTLQTVQNMFILNLSVADMVVTLLSLPITPIANIYKEWHFGRVMCHLIPWVQGTSIFILIYTLTAISINRYFLILHPYIRALTPKKALLIILFIWTTSMALTVPYGYNMELFEYRDLCGEFCSEAWPKERWPHLQRTYAICIYCIQLIIPSIIMLYCYISILLRLRQRTNSRIDRLNQSDVDQGGGLVPPQSSFATSGFATTNIIITEQRQSQRERLVSRKRRTTLILICMVGIFIGAWLPFQTIQFILEFSPAHFELVMANGESIDFTYIITTLTHCIAMTNVVSNPFLYAWLNQTFKQSIIRTLLCLVPRFCLSTSCCCCYWCGLEVADGGDGGGRRRRASDVITAQLNCGGRGGGSGMTSLSRGAVGGVGGGGRLNGADSVIRKPTTSTKKNLLPDIIEHNNSGNRKKKHKSDRNKKSQRLILTSSSTTTITNSSHNNRYKSSSSSGKDTAPTENNNHRQNYSINNGRLATTANGDDNKYLSASVDKRNTTTTIVGNEKNLMQQQTNSGGRKTVNNHNNVLTPKFHIQEEDDFQAATAISLLSKNSSSEPDVVRIIKEKSPTPPPKTTASKTIISPKDIRITTPNGDYDGNQSRSLYRNEAFGRSATSMLGTSTQQEGSLQHFEHQKPTSESIGNQDVITKIPTNAYESMIRNASHNSDDHHYAMIQTQKDQGAGATISDTDMIQNNEALINFEDSEDLRFIKKTATASSNILEAKNSLTNPTNVTHRTTSQLQLSSKLSREGVSYIQVRLNNNINNNADATTNLLSQKITVVDPLVNSPATTPSESGSNMMAATKLKCLNQNFNSITTIQGHNNPTSSSSWKTGGGRGGAGHRKGRQNLPNLVLYNNRKIKNRHNQKMNIFANLSATHFQPSGSTGQHPQTALGNENIIMQGNRCQQTDDEAESNSDSDSDDSGEEIFLDDGIDYYAPLDDAKENVETTRGKEFEDGKTLSSSNFSTGNNSMDHHHRSKQFMEMMICCEKFPNSYINANDNDDDGAEFNEPDHV